MDNSFYGQVFITERLFEKVKNPNYSIRYFLADVNNVRQCDGFFEVFISVIDLFIGVESNANLRHFRIQRRGQGNFYCDELNFSQQDPLIPE